jgi:hypothetical protein
VKERSRVKRRRRGRRRKYVCLIATLYLIVANRTREEGERKMWEKK